MSAHLWASLQVIERLIISIIIIIIVIIIIIIISITYFSFWVSYLIKLQANSQTQYFLSKLMIAKNFI